MRRGPSGTYEITATAGEAVRAFVPAPAQHVAPRMAVLDAPGRNEMHEVSYGEG